jgi:hypothetical protein
MDVTDEIILQLNDFVQTIAAEQYLPSKKFIFEMLFGMIASGSVVLAEIARKLEPDKRLIHIEKRLSNELASPRLDEKSLQQKHLQWVVEQIKEDTVISFDIGDIVKKYAKKMENLAKVWDGSEGEKGNGYWLIEVEGHQNTGQRFGIWLDVFSQKEKDFISQNSKIIEVLEQVSKAAKRRGISVFDRGFDAKELMLKMDELFDQYIVRQKGNRYVQRAVFAGKNGKKFKLRRLKSVRAVADDVKLKYRMQIWHRDKTTGKWIRKNLRYGFCSIFWPENGKIYSLVVVLGFGKEVLMLWTNIKVEDEASASYVLKAFMRRWAVEDCGRVIKQEFELEKVRVEGFLSIRRSVILAGLAYGFVGLIGRLEKTVIAFLVGLVRAFREPKKVWAYRIRQALAELWEDGLLFRPSNFG